MEGNLRYGFEVLLGLLFVYMLPTFVAGQRRHIEMLAIVVLNLLLGWTLLGWAVALVWSLTSNVRPSDAPILATDRVAALIMCVPFVILGLCWYFTPGA